MATSSSLRSRRRRSSGSEVITLAPRSRPAIAAAEALDHIVATGHSAELPGSSSLAVVENEHLAERRAKEPGKASLAGAVSPGLRDHAGRHEQRVVVL